MLKRSHLSNYHHYTRARPYEILVAKLWLLPPPLPPPSTTLLLSVLLSSPSRPPQQIYCYGHFIFIIPMCVRCARLPSFIPILFSIFSLTILELNNVVMGCHCFAQVCFASSFSLIQRIVFVAVVVINNLQIYHVLNFNNLLGKKSHFE